MIWIVGTSGTLALAGGTLALAGEYQNRRKFYNFHKNIIFLVINTNQIYLI